ncbi:membrane protein [Brevundimonas denitrificans]|uniref:Membrane protein n=1 Tax=Brevundimonas denitrificans TaxID=1443434 RepID=A0ABQ6BJ50_9CAUL|nr:hypothetical protein [Brevundimonas denitrificans]GLS01232.1 membrane protein [Brevundimonas denitrificans]
MADASPDAPREPRFTTGHDSEGRPAALIAWGLYILSLPSANLLVIVGLIVAYAGRGGSDGLSRAHIDAQIRLFWSVFWWTILLWIGIAICVVSFLAVNDLGFVLIPVALLLGLGLLFLTVWFTIRSIIGLINLLGDKAP